MGTAQHGHLAAPRPALRPAAGAAALPSAHAPAQHDARRVCRRRGVSNRDVKLENLLVDARNPEMPLLKVSDFSYAKVRCTVGCSTALHQGGGGQPAQRTARRCLPTAAPACAPAARRG